MKTMHRQIAILASAQALFQTASVMVMTIAALAASEIASAKWATLPIATMFLGMAVVTFPASIWMARVGRRVGFLVGTMMGVAGGLVAAFGVHQRSLAWLAAGTFCVGTYQAFAQFYRFAAGEAADDEFRSRAISFVMAGGIVAALIGPVLARVGGSLFETTYVGSFLILSAVSLVAGTVLLGLKPMRVVDDAPSRAKARRWWDVVRQPAYLVALFGAATGYGIMILAMTATPLAMKHHDHAVGSSATVIQLHTLGMFVPSLFTGALIARFGAVPVMLAGAALFVAHISTTLVGTGFMPFAVALMMLGVGWNFMFVGGTTLLTETYTPAERASAQATNDMAIVVIGFACSALAGPMLAALGWQRLNLVLLPWLLVAVAALVVSLRRFRAAK